MMIMSYTMRKRDILTTALGCTGMAGGMTGGASVGMGAASAEWLLTTPTAEVGVVETMVAPGMGRVLPMTAELATL